MSVYGGFLTKKQSLSYFHLLEDIVRLLSNMVMDSLTKNVINYAQFRGDFLDTYTHIRRLEERKYMEPKYSLTLDPLFQLCYDHTFFIPKEPSQPPLLTFESRDGAWSKDSKSKPEKSLDLQSVQEGSACPRGVKPTVAKFFSKIDNEFHQKQQGQQQTIVSNGNQQNHSMLQKMRPMTTGLSRKLRNLSMSVQVDNLRTPLKAQSGTISGRHRKGIYEEFEKSYGLPPPPVEYEKKLSRLRKNSTLKYSIDQLF